MKTQNLVALVLASTGYAQQVTKSSQEFDCTHLILGSPKSRSTAVARALCHALQKQGGTSCIHEPFRLEHEMALVNHVGESIQYSSNKTTLCKDMLFHPIETESYQHTVKEAIKATENTVVFLKSDPTRSFVSLVGLVVEEVERNNNVSLKRILNNKQQIDQFNQQAFTELLEMAAGNGAALPQMKAVAQLHNKSFVEIEEKNLSKNPVGELNRVLTSWNAPPIALDHDLKMSPNLYLDTDGKKSSEAFATCYQVASEDSWDTTEGDVFNPSIRSQSRDEKVQALMNKYVAKNMHSYFKTCMNNYFTIIEKVTVDAEKRYRDPLTTTIHNEL